MSDPTESIRRTMVAEINAEPGSREYLEAKHGQVWDTTQMQQDFEVMGFMAPLIVVRRKVRWRLWKLDLPALATILLRLSSGLINHVQPSKGHRHGSSVLFAFLRRGK